MECESSSSEENNGYDKVIHILSCPDTYFTLTMENGEWNVKQGIASLDDDRIVECDKERTIVANVHETNLECVNGVDVCTLDNNSILNLSDDGERWEGGVLDNQPCGWGIFYDKENNVQYEGFRYQDTNVCYGISYYADIRKIEYEGGLCDGKRWGHGALYDRNGKVVYNGEWIDDNQIVRSASITKDNEMNTVLHNHLTELIIGDDCFCAKTLYNVDFSIMPILTKLSVGFECFMYTKHVIFCNMHFLESIVIGEHSFMRNKQLFRDEEGEDPEYDYSFVLIHCERLKELRIGTCSFYQFGKCHIEDNPSLEKIEMGTVGSPELGFVFSYATLSLISNSHNQSE